MNLSICFRHSLANIFYVRSAYEGGNLKSLEMAAQKVERCKSDKGWEERETPDGPG